MARQGHERGAGTYSKAVPDSRDKVKRDTSVDRVSGNPTAKRHALREQVLEDTAFRAKLPKSAR